MQVEKNRKNTSTNAKPTIPRHVPAQVMDLALDANKATVKDVNRVRNSF